MKTCHTLLWAVIACAANAHAAYAPVDLGTVNSFVTYDDSNTPTFGTPYDRVFNFNLPSATTVRVDMRELGYSHWLTEYARGLGGATLTLLDASKKVMGTAAIDPTFNGSDGGCLSGGKCSGNFAEGLTLTKDLVAGQYALELTGFVLGTSATKGPLLIGVADVHVAAIQAYLTQLTPATNLPEPATWASMGLGLVGMMGVMALNRRRRGATA
jgi:hypothetical protein